VTRARRIAALVALALAAALVLLGGAAAWLVTTQAGLERGVALLESLENVEVRVEGATGRLAGPLAVGRLHLRAARVTVDAEGIRAEYGLTGLLFGRLRLESVTAASARIELGPPEPERPRRPPRFLPRWLAIDVGSLAVARAELHQGGQLRLAARELQAQGTITHARLLLEEARLDAGYFTADGSAELVAREPLGLGGELAWTLGRARELAGRLTAHGDLDRLEVEGAVVAPLAATLRGALTSIGPDLAWQAETDVARFALADLGLSAPLGPLRGRVSGSGSVSRAALEAHVDGEGLPAAGVDLAARLGIVGSAIEIERFQATLPGGPDSIEARGRIELGDRPGLALDADWRELRWPFEGEPLVQSASGRLGVAGWRQLAFALDGQVRPRGVPQFGLSAHGSLDSGGIVLSAAEAAGPLGRASISGFLGFGDARAWQAQAQVTQLDLGRLRPGLDSRLAFQVAGSGAGVGDGFGFAGAVSGIAGTVRGQRARGSGLVRYRPGRLEFNDVSIDLGPARLGADGWTGADTRLSASLRVEDLADFAPQFGGRVDARLEASSPRAAAGGPQDLLLDLALRGRDLAWGQERAAVLSADALVDLGDLDSSWARLRAAGLTVAGQSVSSIRVSLDGYARMHRFEFQVGAGERAIDLEGEGSFINGVYRLTASSIAAAGPGVRPWSLEAPVVASASAQAATLEQTCLVQDVRRVCFDAGWRRGQRWSAALRTESFPLQALDVTLPGRPGYEGQLDLEASVEGLPGRPWTGRADARLRDAEFTYVAPSGRPERLVLGSTEILARSEPGQHRVTVALRDTDVLRLDGEATIVRREGLGIGESPLAGALRLATRQLGLLPLMVPDIDRADGLLNADLAFAGTAGAPAVSGTVSLAEGALDFYQTNLRLRGLAARFDLEDNLVRVDARGEAGKGAFRVDGMLGWRDRELSGRLDFSGTRLLVADLPELRVEASPALTFRLDGRDVAVSGSVAVPAARIEPRQFTGAVTASPDEVIAGPETAAPGQPYRVTTDVRLSLGREVRLDAFGLQGALQGEVLLQLRPDEVPVASGELEVRDGKYRAYTKELDVERGRLLFAGGPVDDPGVDLRAGQKLPGYEVGVLVRGRLRKPELTLYSDPSMPQSQIASLLLVGRTLDSLQSGDREALGSSTDLATQGGALLAGQLGRYVGLDDVGLESGVDREAALVLGKFLSPRLYVSYGISLTDAINTFKIRYTIGDRWVIRGESGRESSADIEYTIDR
jgi:translocation and assembly module TamB